MFGTDPKRRRYQLEEELRREVAKLRAVQRQYDREQGFGLIIKPMVRSALRDDIVRHKARIERLKQQIASLI